MNTSELIKLNENTETSVSKHIWWSMLPVLKQNTSDVPLDNVVAYKYRFDFCGLLQHLGVTPEYIYPNIIVNNYRTSNEFDGTLQNIKIINAQYLHRIYSKINSIS